MTIMRTAEYNLLFDKSLQFDAGPQPVLSS